MTKYLAVSNQREGGIHSGPGLKAYRHLWWGRKWHSESREDKIQRSHRFLLYLFLSSLGPQWGDGSTHIQRLLSASQSLLRKPSRDTLKGVPHHEDTRMCVLIQSSQHSNLASTSWFPPRIGFRWDSRQVTSSKCPGFIIWNECWWRLNGGVTEVCQSSDLTILLPPRAFLDSSILLSHLGQHSSSPTWLLSPGLPLLRGIKPIPHLLPSWFWNVNLRTYKTNCWWRWDKTRHLLFLLMGLGSPMMLGRVKAAISIMMRRS